MTTGLMINSTLFIWKKKLNLNLKNNYLIKHIKILYMCYEKIY